MTTKPKTFDCVEMKNRIQTERMAEYNRQRDKFSCYCDFVKTRVEKSDWVRQMRKKFTTI